jgi:carboxymethylenebutenolidase
MGEQKSRFKARDMGEAAGFRATFIAAFAPTALGHSDPSTWRDTVTREYRLPGGTPLIHAAPAHGEPVARLVVVPSLRGHNAMFGELCTRLAQRHGYEVISPELFPGRQHLTEPERIAFCATMDDAAVLDDVVAASALLGSGPRIVMGFCLGGMFAMKALARDHFAGAIAFYGFTRLPPDWVQEGRVEPLASVAQSSRPVLGLYGALDPLVTAEDIQALEAAGGFVFRYEGVGHAFAHDPLLPSYSLPDAADAWRNAQSFIAKVSSDG